MNFSVFPPLIFINLNILLLRKELLFQADISGMLLNWLSFYFHLSQFVVHRRKRKNLSHFQFISWWDFAQYSEVVTALKHNDRSNANFTSYYFQITSPISYVNFMAGNFIFGFSWQARWTKQPLMDFCPNHQHV